MASLTEHKCQRNVTLTNVIQKLSLLKDLMQLKKHTVQILLLLDVLTSSFIGSVLLAGIYVTSNSLST